VNSGRQGCAAALLVAVLSVGSIPGLAAQERLRAAVMGDPQIGSPAPDFTLPYLTAAGPGPTGQPFHLRAELGRRVVLVFSPSPEHETARPLWERLVAQRDSLVGPGTVLVGLFRAPPAPVGAFAASLTGGFKFLPDTSASVFRRFGVSPATAVAQVFVIDDDGRVLGRIRRLALDDAEGWRALGGSVRR
jgi:peroxiredoxin Q/BCP